MRINTKAFGLVIGGAAVVAAAAVVMGNDSGTVGRGVTLAKNGVAVSSSFPFSTPPPVYVRSDGYDSAMTTTNPGS